MDLLDESVQTIKGIGPKKAKLLSRLGIYTFKDALYFFPRDYEKHGGVINIASIQKNQKVSLCVKFCGKPQVTRKRKNLSILKWRAKDNTVRVCVCLISLTEQISIRKTWLTMCMEKQCFHMDKFQSKSASEYKLEVHDEGRLDPIYSLVEGLTQKILGIL